ncbi:hypothetical protein BH10BDE1_BH10BDE1_03250 [soil metagenome]
MVDSIILNLNLGCVEGKQLEGGPALFDVLTPNSNQLQQFARDAAGVLYDFDRIGVSREMANAAVELEIQDLLKLNAIETKAKRCKHFAVEGVSESDYSENFYRLNDGRLVLAGIRHLAGSKDEPFAHFVVSFVPDESDLKTLVQFARETFAMFRPKQISFSVSTATSVIDTLGQNLRASRNHVVGRVADIRKRDHPKFCQSIQLEPLQSTENFGWYDRAYEAFHLAQPELKSWVPITDREDLEACARDGLLFEVKIDGARAGLIAAEKSPLLGLVGAYMTEFLLLAPFKGRGLAPALQRLFVEKLPGDVELIWGTIDARNFSSMKTAEKVGRVPIRAECFLAVNTIAEKS